MVLYGAETWTPGRVYHKYLDRFGMWCRRRMKISWTDRVRNITYSQEGEECPTDNKNKEG